MIAKTRKLIHQKGPLISRLLLMSCFFIEFILCIVILSGNSSPPSLAMTIPRMLASLTSYIFVLFLLKKFLKDNYQMLAVKGLACLSILIRVLAFVMVKYFVRNPTEQCYVSMSASGALSYMDVMSCVAILMLMWQYIREERI